MKLLSILSALTRIWRGIWVFPIFLYQKFISPALPDSCLYEPGCSTYARESILKHGVIPGILLALLRVLRCTGLLFSGGEDPVPEKIQPGSVFGPWRRFWRWNKKPR